MNIVKFDKRNLDTVRKAIVKALKPVGESLGLTLDIGNISYQADSFKTPLTVKVGTDPKAHAKAEWDKYCSMFGFKKEHFGKTITQGVNVYKIVGIAPKSSKYPVIVEKNDEKGVKLTLSAFRKLEGYDTSYI